MDREGLYNYSSRVSFHGSREGILERLELELRGAGWKNVMTEEGFLSAEHGSPFVFRHIGVFLGGKRFIPANLSVRVCGDEKTMRVQYDFNPGKYTYKYFIACGVRAIEGHAERTVGQISSAGNRTG